MKTVYRVQHKDENIGPYTSDYCSGEWYYRMLEHHRDNEHPNKWEDYYKNHSDVSLDHVFGFSSLEKLSSWFDGYLMSLIYEGGFIITQYKVEDYIEGQSGKQVVFIPTEFINITPTFIQQAYADYIHFNQG